MGIKMELYCIDLCVAPCVGPMRGRSGGGRKVKANETHLTESGDRISFKFVQCRGSFVKKSKE
jgi:hypothetical protein